MGTVRFHPIPVSHFPDSHFFSQGAPPWIIFFRPRSLPWVKKCESGKCEIGNVNPENVKQELGETGDIRKNGEELKCCRNSNKNIT